MAVPAWLLRKLYRRGSLVQIGEGRFRITLQNPLSDATLVAPPRVVINGVHYTDERITGPVDLAKISAVEPFEFPKGSSFDLEIEGHLLRGANRIHITALTDEFGELDIFVEDKAIQDHCDLPDKQ